MSLLMFDKYYTDYIDHYFPESLFPVDVIIIIIWPYTII